MGRKKLNLNTDNQVNGKIEKEYQPTTLDEVFGFNYNKYAARTKEEYNLQIDEMNTADLRAEAVRVGFMPAADVGRLKKKLIGEFDKYLFAINKNNHPKPTKPVVPTKEALLVMADVK